MVEQGIYGLSYVQNLSYVGMFFAVAFSGYVIPIPEELILILGGFLAAQGISDPFLLALVSILGAITGDSIIFYLSGHGSRFTKKYHERVEKTHVGWYMRHMRNNTGITIFCSRFIVGMRFLNPLVSGLMKVSWKTFVLATSLSAVIYIPFVIWLGYYFHRQIHLLLHIAHSLREVMLAGIAIGSVVLIILFLRNLIEK